MAINFLLGYYIIKKPTKVFLILGIFLNVLFLFIFKYYNFFLDIFTFFVSLKKHHTHWALPLAISFFTFQQISYLVSCYQKKINSTSIQSYMLFVCFFPQLIAGPIVRFENMVIQFRDHLGLKSSTFSQGLIFLTLGLLKKLLFADNLAPVANQVFDNFSYGIHSFDLWVGLLAYTLQIYFDFSGYCDMAVGLGLFFGISLPFNFDSPYRSFNISQFWQKWHITLSAFFRSYIYIPLGGNRINYYRTVLNLIITMFLVGLWHGDSWNFIVWGLLHGFYLLTYHLFKKKIPIDFSKSLFFVGGSWAITFFCLTLAWVFFRAENIHLANNILQNLFYFTDTGTTAFLEWQYYLVFFCLTLALSVPNSQQWVKKISQAKKNFFLDFLVPVATAGAFMVLVLGFLSETNEEFIYFQF